MEPQRVGFETVQVKQNKVRYVPLQRITKEMSASEKKGTEIWNEMVTWIRDHGGMEDKD
ncbi:hypothetical protein [Paenibacillus jilunlii]|uniref:Uncharacterized protein n=1 Tax=Paenibacillus jilunlii TaxID=682956 RepID=A0A1H0A153_9BACL|nr:hypothetical protein [Paenibacillus jilunlii]SDN26426.1 hypothetical protein SAMN05216191_1346 [Paenibacillus jilunlii]